MNLREHQVQVQHNLSLIGFLIFNPILDI